MSDTNAKLAHRAGVVMAGTLASRVLGVARDSVIAACFPTAAIDAFQVAFMIPNSFRRLTAEGSFSISVTTVFSKLWAANDRALAQRFARAVFGFSLAFLAVLTILGVVFAEQLAWLAGSGFQKEPEKFALATELTRWMFPYVLLVSLTALAMGLLNSAGRFFTPAFAPVLLNVATIACALGLSAAMIDLGLPAIFSLAIGTLIGGAAQVALQIGPLRKLGLLVRPTLDFSHPELRKVLKLTGPMVFGAAAYQVGLFISASFASSLGRGAVTYIQFATRLLELPLAVLVMAISTAALPSLALLKSQGKIEEMKGTYGYSLRLALFVTTPAMVALIALAEPIVTVLFQRGLFSHADALQTASDLQWMAAGICSVALIRQTVPVFYALEQVLVPVLMTLLYIAVYVASALLLKGPFSHQGLCAALSLAATAQSVGLVIALRRRIGPLGMRRTAKSFSKSLAATAPMAAAAYGVAQLGSWSEGGNSLRNIGILLAAIAVGVIIYVLAARLLRVEELEGLIAGLKRRMERKRAST